MPEIQRLTGHLIYAKHPSGKSPYNDTYAQQWDDVATEFVKQACNLIGQVRQSQVKKSGRDIFGVGSAQSIVGDGGCRLCGAASVDSFGRCDGEQWPRHQAMRAVAIGSGARS